ncbi:MAG: GTPase ObgE, partial [Salegentibacter sp.]
GHRFLRHIERNSTLLFLVPADAEDISKQYEILLDELRRYNPEMLDKDRLVAISKSDMLDAELKAELKAELDKNLGAPYLFISSVAQQGLTELKDRLWEMLNKEPV